MSRLLVLEAFDDQAATGFADMSFDMDSGFGDLPEEPAAEAEDQASVDEHEIFERGYRAGWDDCERQAQESRQAVGAELARNIQELGFTYHEARAHVLGALEPLLSGIVQKILPGLAADTIGQSVVEELSAIAANAADTPVTILVSPQSHDMIAQFLESTTALPYHLVTEETLSDWQVFFRLGDHERQLDLDSVIARIGERLEAFTDQNQKVLRHG